MALFKIGKGNSKNLPTEKKEGYAYFTTNDGKMYIDVDNSTRVALNAANADTIGDSSYSYTATTIHSGLDAASAKVYTATINTGDWPSSSPFTYTYSKTSLRCGTDGNVPPIIYSSSDDFYLITSAAAAKGSGIVFTASSKPTNAIELTIIDMG
jgi:hypothetical protein